MQKLPFQDSSNLDEIIYRIKKVSIEVLVVLTMSHKVICKLSVLKLEV
jgi:hypothetical protein